MGEEGRGGGEREEEVEGGRGERGRGGRREVGEKV